MIQDDIRDVVDRMAEECGKEIYYLYGHRLEIAKRLTEKNADMIEKYRKYPLVALNMDISENHLGTGTVEYDLNLIILDFTDRNYTSEDRDQNVFQPVLEPLYQLFLKSLRDVSEFDWVGLVPPHTKILRPFWGSLDPQSNIFSDPLDGIEITNLKLIKHSCYEL